jgi:hypothetical protein
VGVGGGKAHLRWEGLVVARISLDGQGIWRTISNDGRIIWFLCGSAHFPPHAERPRLSSGPGPPAFLGERVSTFKDA